VIRKGRANPKENGEENTLLIRNALAISCSKQAVIRIARRI
jgi:hypothetical protein